MCYKPFVISIWWALLPWILSHPNLLYVEVIDTSLHQALRVAILRRHRHDKHHPRPKQKKTKHWTKTMKNQTIETPTLYLYTIHHSLIAFYRARPCHLLGTLHQHKRIHLQNGCPRHSTTADLLHLSFCLGKTQTVVEARMKKARMEATWTMAWTLPPVQRGLLSQEILLLDV